MNRKWMVAVILLTAITGNLYARQATKTIGLDNVKSLQNGSGYLNNRNIKAARDFAQRYPDLEGSWFAAKNGFVVRFTKDSCSCRAAYDARGNWMYTIKSYSETKLPKAVRHVVKSTYYDYTITQIEEIERPNESLVYMVHMYDAATWMNVLVQDGEIAVLEAYQKSNP